MLRHPYAMALASPSYTTTNAVIRANRRQPDDDPLLPNTASSGSSSFPEPTRRPTVPFGVKLNTSQQHRRPTGKFVLHDAGVTLTLRGQEEHAHFPVYGRCGTVDGVISFSNPWSVLKVEAKIEGYVSVNELAGHGSARTVVLSETLVYWDAPDRISSDAVAASAPLLYNSASSPIASTSSSGFCPPSLAFRTTLPATYAETDGTVTPLPPSFYEALPSVPGFKGEVAYSLSVVVTRVRDVKRPSSWRKNVVLKTPLVYHPRARPSQPPPFPANTTKAAGTPVTRFESCVESKSAYVRSLKTQVYLPNAQVTPISSPIPFFLKLSGEDAALKPFLDTAPLPSFLPTISSDSLTSSISDQISDRLHCLGQLSRSTLSLATASSGSHSRSSSRSSGADSRSSQELLIAAGGTPTVRVRLVRTVSVDARGTSFPSEDSLEVGAEKGDSKRSRSNIYKSTVIGEGAMYMTRIGHESVTWAGEVCVDPKMGVRCGGFQTRSLAVRDMLIVSIKHQNPGASPLQEFRQIIPVQLTTDAFEPERNEN